MPLSLESIYKPLADFFVNTFETSPESPVVFRFRKFGSVISSGDYIDPAQPENTAKAAEAFSDFTNWMPMEDPNGVNVYFGAALIDSRYNGLLSPARAFVHQGEPNGQAIENAFHALRNDALLNWEVYSRARNEFAEKYRLSFAAPSNWYDPANSENWTTHNFEVTETVIGPAGDPNFQIWRFALGTDQLIQILPSLGSTQPIHPTALVEDLIESKPEFSGSLHFHTGNNSPVQPAAPHHDDDDINDDWPDLTDPPEDNDEVDFEELRFRRNIKRLNFNNRVVVLDYVREFCPTRPTSTTTLKISFEYCTVQIRRPWFIEAFISNRSWFIPGTPQGSESAPGQQKLTLLPVEMIAIRNLNIEADWSQVDIAASRTATNFGPFEIKTEIVNNRMSHPGTQIIGYLLQRLPELPPNDPAM